MKRILCLWFKPAAEDCKLQIADAKLRELAEWCTRYSPLVGIEQSSQPECLFLDITGSANLFGGEEKLLETILRDFAERGIVVLAAIADTIGAAWAIAHYGKPSQSQSQFSIFNFQFSICNPSSFILHPASFAPLRPLPIEALRLSEATVSLLHQLGIWRIEQLEALPRKALTSRFGPELLDRWDQATGRLAEPLPACDPPPRFEVRWSPEYPTARREMIEAALEHLLGRIAAMLSPQGLGAMRLECRLTCAAGETVEVAVGLFQPTAWPRHLFQLLQVRLEQVRLPGPVEAVYLAATSTAPLERRQQELFADGPSRGHPRQLAGLVDRLSNRLGHDAVVRARLLPEAQPELAYRYDSLVGRRAARKAVQADLPLRPVRLLAEPVGIGTTNIARSWGPERIETGWWRGRAVGRDYYRVETIEGRRLWVFRRLKDSQWFLHGMFD